MEIVIEIGDNPSETTINELLKFKDDQTKQVRYYDHMLHNNNVTINNVSHFLLYHVNTLILRYIISQNDDTPDDLRGEFNLNPNNVTILEVHEDGDEVCIQNEEGLVDKNYYNSLMNTIMDGYYDVLSYYEPK